MDNKVYNEAIRKVSSGYSQQFAEFCAGDERVHDIIMELATKFVEEQIPVLDEDAEGDVAYELFMGITVRSVWL